MSKAHDPDPLLDSLTGLVAARALITATGLGIFDALAEGPLDADGVAARLELDPLGAETLLTALLAMRYVDLDEDGTFRNGAVAERRLVRSSPDSIATFVGSQGDLHWEVLGMMTEAVRSGDAYAMHETRHEDAANWEAYMRGLYEISRDDHALDAKLVPLEAPRRLVDIAGGHGGFSMAMCRRSRVAPSAPIRASQSTPIRSTGSAHSRPLPKNRRRPICASASASSEPSSSASSRSSARCSALSRRAGVLTCRRWTCGSSPPAAPRCGRRRSCPA